MNIFMSTIIIIVFAGMLAGLLFMIWLGYKFVQDITKSDPPDCKYKLDDIGSDVYSTECGHQFYDASETGNPVTDWATYCPYCGGKIKL